jgi:muconolactone delta-isomerase
MFRCAGSNLSYSIWEAETAEDLDAALRSLPAFPSIMSVTVTPIIKHPVEEAYEQKFGPIPPLGR